MTVKNHLQVLYNGRIHTMSSTTPEVSALVIDHGRILAIGSDDQIWREFRDQRNAHNLQGRAVIPGLIDAHIHLSQYALSLEKVDCETSSRSECLRRVAERAGVTPAGEWILGHGWNQNDWHEGFGTAADLDAVAPHHPVYLTAKSLHAAWANTAALLRAGISSQTPDPEGGKIGRDPSGKPDGILFESAMELVARVIPEPEGASLTQAIEKAQSSLWQMGLTGVHDFDRRACFSSLQSLREDGRLRLRVVKSIPLEDLLHAAALGLRTGFGDDFLRIGAIKAFADGALGPQTAAMLQPYEGNPENRGMLLLDAEQLIEHGKIAVKSGLSLAVHAIGDRAVHEVLEAMQALRGIDRTLRHRIEHVQLIHPGDTHRLGELGIIASMQPIHATSDMFMADRHWGRRASLSYAWRTQLNHHAVLAFGSDAPVESPNPFWGIHAAVTRRRQDGAPAPEGWYPEQRLSISEALHGYTTGPAYAAGWEHCQGQLMPGFFADLIVLDEDPFTCDPEKLPMIKPVATMVAGEWVYRE